MKRLGYFTGTIYDDDYNVSKINECCLVLNSDSNIEEEKAKLKQRCAGCFGCPASNESI